MAARAARARRAAGRVIRSLTARAASSAHHQHIDTAGDRHDKVAGGGAVRKGVDAVTANVIGRIAACRQKGEAVCAVASISGSTRLFSRSRMHLRFDYRNHTVTAAATPPARIE